MAGYRYKPTDFLPYHSGGRVRPAQLDDPGWGYTLIRWQKVTPKSPVWSVHLQRAGGERFFGFFHRSGTLWVDDGGEERPAWARRNPRRGGGRATASTSFAGKGISPSTTGSVFDAASVLRATGRYPSGGPIELSTTGAPATYTAEPPRGPDPVPLETSTSPLPDLTTIGEPLPSSTYVPGIPGTLTGGTYSRTSLASQPGVITPPGKLYRQLIDPQLWRLSDGGDRRAMEELQRRGPAHWLPAKPNPPARNNGGWRDYKVTFSVGWRDGRPAYQSVTVRARSEAEATNKARKELAPFARGQPDIKTLSNPAARGFEFMHADDNEYWAEWAMARQGIPHRGQGYGPGAWPVGAQANPRGNSPRSALDVLADDDGISPALERKIKAQATRTVGRYRSVQAFADALYDWAYDHGGRGAVDEGDLEDTVDAIALTAWSERGRGNPRRTSARSAFAQAMKDFGGRGNRLFTLLSWRRAAPGVWRVTLRDNEINPGESVAAMLHASGELWVSGYGQPAPAWAERFEQADMRELRAGYRGKKRAGYKGKKNPKRGMRPGVAAFFRETRRGGGGHAGQVEQAQDAALLERIRLEDQRLAELSRRRKRKKGLEDASGLSAAEMRRLLGLRRNPQGRARLRSRGSGSRGGYTRRERAALPTSMFLKPRTRSWPVADERHVEIAIQYMTAGRGRPSEYPTLIRRMAKLWPVAQYPHLWKIYSRNRSKIATKYGGKVPTLAQLKKARGNPRKYYGIFMAWEPDYATLTGVEERHSLRTRAVTSASFWGGSHTVGGYRGSQTSRRIDWKATAKSALKMIGSRPRRALMIWKVTPDAPEQQQEMTLAQLQAMAGG